MVRFMIFVETMYISWGKKMRYIRSCYDHNPAFNLCKDEKKKNDPFEEMSMYRNTSKTGMHILYHIKIDIMS